MPFNFRSRDELHEVPAVCAEILLQIVYRIDEMGSELELDSSQKDALRSWIKSLRTSLQAA